MERQRGSSTHQERNNIGLPNPSTANFTPPPPPQINQLESPVKLPLAPIISTAPDRRGISHATLPASTRRGGAIFSPAVQTLDHHHHHNNIPPPQLSPPPPPPKNPTPDPDPAAPSTKTPPPPPPAPPPAHTVRYKECLKNHAANMGGHVVDGCGEFMPGGEEGSPEYLRCAACDCHRNFHRKEVEGEPQASSHYYSNNNNNTHRSTPQSHGHHQKQSHSHHAHEFSGPPTMVKFGGGAAAESSSEDLNMFRSEGHGPGGGSSSRKRFRTKFSQDQKDKMQEFAAKIGWSIQKQDEQEVQRFCSEVGVKRQVFKVWMHNNKQAIKKRSQTSSE